MVFEDAGGLAKIARFGFAAVGLDMAEGVEGLVVLAMEAIAVAAEIGEGALLGAEGFGDGEGGVEVGNVDVDAAGGRGSLEGEQVILDGGNAAESPGGVGKFLDQDVFGGAFGLEFVEEVLDVALVGGEILGGEEGGGGGESMGDGVVGGMGFAGVGAAAGGVQG